MRALVTFLLIAFLCAPWLSLTPVSAEDEEVSEAARLFREAWWLETGSAALDKASAAYRQAVAAEGSAEVRARAQYRLAVVLERMGRTEDALRALETLAKDFPEQRDLLAQARTRMEEWSGEDLRAYFSDWYRRYQYSPAFQSKIVDLILQLASPEGGQGAAAREELLTIGEPALAALREHADSANQTLREAVVTLLIQLGDVPEPSALYDTRWWERQATFWGSLAKQEGAARAAQLAAARAHPEDPRAAWIEAVLSGPEAIVAALAKSPDTQTNLPWALLPTLLEMRPDAAVYERVRALPFQTSVRGSVRGQVASFLARNHDWKGAQPDPTGFGAADILRYAESDEAAVRHVAWQQMFATDLGEPEAWGKPASWLTKATQPSNESRAVVGALLGQLRVAGVLGEEDERLAVEGLVAALRLQSVDSNTMRLLEPSTDWAPGSPALPRRIFAQAIGDARGEFVARPISTWWKAAKADPAAIDTLLAWARDGADGNVRQEAVELAAREIRSGVGRLLAALDDPARRIELRRPLLRRLDNNPALESLDWDVASLLRLLGMALQEAQQKPPAGPVRASLDANVFGLLRRLLRDGSIRTLFFQAGEEAPERVPAELWRFLEPGWNQAAENRAQARSFLVRGWEHWNPAQKEAGLALFLAEALVGRGDPELDAFLRRCLTDPALLPAGRQRAAQALSQLTLEDVQAAFDLSVPAEAELASALLAWLPADVRVYAAFKDLLGEASTSSVVVDYVGSRFRESDDGIWIDLVTRLLQVPEGMHAGNRAVEILQTRLQPEALPLWHQALAHPQADIRLAAAQALGSRYDEESIRVLARAVDDADPRVRDAAIASLERIESTEKQKARWRAFAEGRAPAPGK
jgi:hypothetical protein